MWTNQNKTKAATKSIAVFADFWRIKTIITWKLEFFHVRYEQPQFHNLIILSNYDYSTYYTTIQAFKYIWWSNKIAKYSFESNTKMWDGQSGICDKRDIYFKFLSPPFVIIDLIQLFQKLDQIK